MDPHPVLWHLKVSNYNEKARWALDYKHVPHLRRALVPGRHQAVARALSGGSTTPVLVLNGQGIGDSTRIIETLERHYPEPSLYPTDTAARRRALELEDYFDEELGAYVRLLFIHHALPDARLMIGAFVPSVSGARMTAARLAFPALRGGIRSEFKINSRTVEEAYRKVAKAGARFRSQLGPSGYLVGDGFTVADLTLAALVAPAVAPPEFQYPQPQRGHPRLRPLCDALDREGLSEWAREMYSLHREPSAEVLR
jgi:glutathione S-transferase